MRHPRPPGRSIWYVWGLIDRREKGVLQSTHTCEWGVLQGIFGFAGAFFLGPC